MEYIPHFITAIVSALTVGVPSWVTSLILVAKLRTEKEKTRADAQKTLAEADATKLDNFLKLFGEFQELRREFQELRNQLDTKDKHIENCARLIQRISILFREFLDDIDIGFWEADEHGQRVYFNRAWLEMTGMRFNDACGKGWRACVHPDDIERLLERDAAMMFEGATIRPINCRLINQKTGEVIDVVKTLFPVYNSDGTVYRFYGKVRIVPRSEDPT